MKQTALLLIFLLAFLPVFGQNKKIVLETRNNDDRSVSIAFQKQVPGTYYVELKFTTLENAFSSDFHSEIKGPSGILLNLRPVKKDSGIRVGYRYQYILGTLTPKYDPQFVYLLPFSEETRFTVRTMSYLNETFFGADRPEGWVSYQFLCKPGAPVFAARKGLVVEIQEENDYQTEFEVSYQSKVNYILVEHPDGTLARYSGFERGEIMVEEGQEVYPRTFLGSMARYDVKEEAQLRFSLYYLNHVDFNDQTQSLKNPKHFYAFIEPVFLTESGPEKLESGKTYKTTLDEEAITREFSKREKKKYVKQQLDIGSVQ